MNVDVWSDLICPWCYLGKRRLERALASYDGDVTVRYRAFQLDPSPVPAPVPLLEALADKFGGANRTREITTHTAAVAAAEGVTLRFDRAVAANTFDAHRLVALADSEGLQADAVEALHRAHFTEGVDIGSTEELISVAASIGLDAAKTREHLANGAGADQVRADLRTARELGVSSVPTFVLAGRYAVVGAQDPRTLHEALTEAAGRSRH